MSSSSRERLGNPVLRSSTSPSRLRASAEPRAVDASSGSTRVSSSAKNGFPAAAALDPEKRSTRKRAPQALLEDQLKRSEAQRLKPQVRAALGGKGGPEVKRRRSRTVDALAGQDSNRQSLDPPQEELERAEEGRSSHWRSSIATNTGPSSASARMTDRPAAQTARWSRPPGPGSSRNMATAIARCCGSGSPAMSPSITGSSRSARLAKASPASALVGRADNTEQPSGARPTASVKTVVLPIPGSPSKTKAAAPPSSLLRSCAAA